MSANPVVPMCEAPEAEAPEAYQETLTERLGRGRLTLAEALGYATEIAGCLRDLHMQGLVYGAVSSQLVVLSEQGASLRNSGSLARLGNAQGDVTAFGLMLNEMLRRVDGPAALCAEMNSLAVTCQDGAVGMQQAAVTLRLLALKARHTHVRAPGPVLVTPPVGDHASVRLKFSLHWRPLVNLMTSALK
jgi:hypothetical protein